MQKRFTLLLLSFCFSLNAQPVFDHVLLVAATGNGISTEQAEKQIDFMKSFLYDGLGFDNRNLNVLKGAAASKQNIITALQQLKQLPKSDRVFIYFLGNSYAFDTEANNVRGFFLPTELRLDEVLQDPRTYKGILVRDAVSYLDIESLISKMETPNLTVILDSNAAGLGQTASVNAPPFAIKEGHGILYLNTHRTEAIKFENDLTAFSQHITKAFRDCQSSIKPSDIANYFSSNFTTGQVRVYGHSGFADVSYPCLSTKFTRPIIDAYTSEIPTAFLNISNLPDSTEVWSDNQLLSPNQAGKYTIFSKEQNIYIRKKDFEINTINIHPLPNITIERSLSFVKTSVQISLSESIPDQYTFSINQIVQNRNPDNIYPITKGSTLVELQEGNTLVSHRFIANTNKTYLVKLSQDVFSPNIFAESISKPISSQLERKKYVLAGLIATMSLGGTGLLAFQGSKFRNLKSRYETEVLAYRNANSTATALATYEQLSFTHNQIKASSFKKRTGSGLIISSIIMHSLDCLINSKTPLKISIGTL